MNDLAETIQSRIERFCIPTAPDGLGIAVRSLDVDDWADMPLTDVMSMWGWVDPVATDSHPSGHVLVYCPEVIAASLGGLDLSEAYHYLESVMLYITIFVALTERFPDRAERTRVAENVMYDKHYERLALMSRVQVGGTR